NLADCLYRFVFLLPLAHAALNLRYLFVQLRQSVPLLAKRVNDHSRQTLSEPFEHHWYLLVQLASPLAHHLAVFRQQSSQAIGLHRSELEQLLPHPVQPKHRLLHLSFYRYRLAWLLYCQPDRPGVRRIALVADIERFHKLPRHQLHLVAHLRQLPGPVVRTTARFYPDQARRTVREMFKELCPLDRLVHDLAGFLNDVMHLEHVFRDVYADCCTIHDWILRLPWGNFLFSTWAHRCRWPVRIHLDLLTRSRVGRVHFIPRDCEDSASKQRTIARTAGSLQADSAAASKPWRCPEQASFVASVSCSSFGQSVLVSLEFYLPRVNATEPRNFLAAFARRAKGSRASILITLSV